jgi:putative Holliday junction resolvase
MGESMRILGIDPGTRRVGMAVSDALGLTAQGLPTFDLKSGADLVEHIGTLVRQYGVEEIVVGHPVGLRGQRGESSRNAEELATTLRERLRITVTLWDERFSSEEAKRVMRGQRAPKGSVDRVAAAIILQSYLDFRGNAG